MGVGQVQELVPKLGSKEEEISETKCLICFKEFRTVTERKEHFKICRKSLVCEKCSKRFEVVKWYERHIDICDGNDKFRCYSCGDEYKDGKACYDHTRKCGGKLHCKRCDKKFASWRLLRCHHTTVHPKIRCQKCNKIFLLRYELMEHMKTHKDD